MTCLEFGATADSDDHRDALIHSGRLPAYPQYESSILPTQARWTLRFSHQQQRILLWRIEEAHPEWLPRALVTSASPLSFLGSPFLFSRPHSAMTGSLQHAFSLSKALLVFLPPPAWFPFFPLHLLWSSRSTNIKPIMHLCSSWACAKIWRSLPREIFSESGLCMKKCKITANQILFIIKWCQIDQCVLT